MRGIPHIKSLRTLVVPLLRSGCHNRSFWILNAVEPHVTYPNLYLALSAWTKKQLLNSAIQQPYQGKFIIENRVL